ncbi:MAG: 50S ribosomal protein L7ae [Firmicutes bacterium]|nr:50S ribosomal protein L7ae [Bacillota bacterium]
MGGLSLLGLAQRAGKVVSGQFACGQAIQRGRAHLVLIATDAAANTKERYIKLCRRKGISYRVWNLKEEMGFIIGKTQRAVVAIIDENFASALAEKINETSVP